MIFRICNVVAISAMVVAGTVAQHAFTYHVPTTIMDPAGQMIATLEIIAIIASLIGLIWNRS